jgi:hypothetical protein
MPASGSFHGLDRGLPPGVGSRVGGAMGRHSAGLGDMSRGVSILSEACSVASVASAASLEESAFFALGGGAMSLSSTYRMARTALTGDTGLSPTGSLAGSSTSSLMRAEMGADSVRRCFGRSVMDPGAEASFAATNDPLLPRCSEEGHEYSSSGQRPTMSTDAGNDDDVRE